MCADLLLFMAYSVAVNQGLLILMQTTQITNSTAGRGALRLVPLAVLFGFLLNACGFRGPLYLPEDETTAQSAAIQSSETSTQADQEKSDEAEDDDDN